ncbi:hypothetical protein ACFLSQ_11970 [Bacteroidota bacterium]
MKQLTIILIIFIAAISTKAEIDFDIKGYVYNMLTYMNLSKSQQQDYGLNTGHLATNITRLRLMPNLNIGDNSRITMHYEIDGLFSKVNLPFFSSPGITNRQAVKLNWDITKTDSTSDVSFITNHYIDMLYFKQFFDWGEFVFGRQVVTWGVGRIWQPTDLFNPINPANFAKIERDGSDALSGKIYLGDFTDMEFVVNFREMIRDYNYGTRFRSNYEGYDLTAVMGYFDQRAVVGGDFAGNLFDAGVRGEAIYSFKRNDSMDAYIRFILGADYQITGDLYALIEYQYNGEGTNNKDEYMAYFGRLMKGEIQNMGQNYLALMSSYQIHPLVGSSLTNITNLGDGSGMLGVTGTYNMYQDFNIGLGTMFFYGADGGEYSFYPTALYLTVEYFF